MILVTGATGNVGSKAVADLKSTQEPIRALVRSAEKGEALGVPYALGDFAAPDTFAAALEGVDRVLLLCAPTPDQVRLETGFVDACRGAGVQHIVKLSAFGAGEQSVSFLRWHGEIEEHLRNSGVGWTLLRPNLFMDHILTAAAAAQGSGELRVPMGAGRTAWVDTRDVGDFAAAVLRAPSMHAGQTYELTGPEALGWAEIAEKLSAGGREYSYVDVPGEEAAAALRAAGVPDFAADGLTALYGWLRDSDQSRISPVLPLLLAKPARTVDEFLAENRPAYQV